MFIFNFINDIIYIIIVGIVKLLNFVYVSLYYNCLWLGVDIVDFVFLESDFYLIYLIYVFSWNIEL